MSGNNISSQTYGQCCGCRVCGDVCPFGAISFQTDAEGFVYPQVSDACVGCGMCRKVCPELNGLDGNEETATQYVGCLDKNADRRQTGSSGGIFGLLASAMMAEGYKICGAAFDENLKLKHRLVGDERGVEALKKSKYLQSDCSTIYHSVRKEVTEGGKVMFVGTPCQCAALRNYLGDKASEVLLVDFACHGVPSQDLFDRCMKYEEERTGGKVVGYMFRHKIKPYGAPQNFLLTLEKDGELVKRAGRYYEEPFYCGFQKYTTLRPSCYSCKWATTERVGDLTLADFWGVEQATEGWDRTAYPSLVLLNTARGQAAFGKIKERLDYFYTTREVAVRKNGSLVRPTRMSEARKWLFEDLQTLPFAEVVKRHLSDRRAWMKNVYYAIPFVVRKRILKVTKKL